MFEGQAEMVVMDGKEGQLGIVKGHSPLLAILKPGPVRMIAGDNEEVFFTEGGFAEVQPENITILVDSAQRADDLDEAKILKAKEWLGLKSKPILDTLNVLKKIERISEIKDKNSFKFDIEVDGGINFSNFKEVLKAGANVLVSGTTIFKENNGDIKKNIEFLKSI